MKDIFIFLISALLLVSCKQTVDLDSARNEILQTEKAFSDMASEKGLVEAFYYFADENAVIRRGNDSLITGKENIRNYYEKNSNPNARLIWTPDFVGISECGTLGYTYGRYKYSVPDSSGRKNESAGIFHTVWKKQKNIWKFVWD